MKQRSFVIAAVFLVSALSALPTRAGIGRWTPYGPPAGVLIHLAVDPFGRLYAAAESSGVYASADGGRSWHWSGAGMGTERVRAVAVDAAFGDLYAAGETRFFRSADQGATWTVRAQGLDFGAPVPGGDVLAVIPGPAPAVQDTLFLARDTSLFRSADSGATWHRLGFQATPITAILADPRDDNFLFVGTQQPGGLFHSADGGETWAEVTQPELPFPGAAPPFSYSVTQIAAAPTSPTTFFALAGLLLYRSTDAGVTWQSIAPAPPPGEGYVYSVAVVPGSPDTVFSIQQVTGNDDGFAHAGLYSSQDFGTTWTRVDDGTTTFGTLVVAPDGELYTFALDGIAHGEDGGAHWRHFLVGSQYCGYTSTFPSGGLLRWSRDGSRLYSLVGFRLFQSTDGGRRWSTRAQDLSASCIKLSDVQFDPSRSTALFAATDHGVYRSNNGGVSWTSTVPPGHPEDARAFNTLAVLPGSLLVGGGCGIERSEDGGRTWHSTLSCDVLHPEFGEPDFARFVTRLRVDPQRPQVLYAEVTEGGSRHPPVFLPYIYRSKDGGITWKRLSAGATLVAVDPRMAQTLYLAKNGRILRSLNDGRTWKVIGTPGPGASGADLLVDRADSRTLYSAGTLGVYRSTDGGATWAPFSTGLPALFLRNLLRDPRRPVL